MLAISASGSLRWRFNAGQPLAARSSSGSAGKAGSRSSLAHQGNHRRQVLALGGDVGRQRLPVGTEAHLGLQLVQASADLLAASSRHRPCRCRPPVKHATVSWPAGSSRRRSAAPAGHAHVARVCPWAAAPPSGRRRAGSACARPAWTAWGRRPRPARRGVALVALPPSAATSTRCALRGAFGGARWAGRCPRCGCPAQPLAATRLTSASVSWRTRSRCRKYRRQSPCRWRRSAPRPRARGR
jgi:hypothetical protein